MTRGRSARAIADKPEALQTESDPLHHAVDFWPEPPTIEQLHAESLPPEIVVPVRSRNIAALSAEIFIDDDATALVLSRAAAAAPTGETPQ